MKERIFIYGMGKIGIRTYLQLKDNGLSASGFIDKNVFKQMGGVDGLMCYSIDEYKKQSSSNDIVIYAIKDRSEKMNVYYRLSVPLVDYEEFTRHLEMEYTPIKSIDELYEQYTRIKKVCLSK